jgi:hypothetical protein
MELPDHDIQEAIDLACKIKNGAHIAMRTSLEKIVGREVQATESAGSCCEKSTPSCCE